MSISYSGDPEKYIDCGHIKSSTNTLSGEWTDSFSAASANQDYAINVIDMRGRLFINRKMTLEGRMNIIVEEIDSNKSIVTVSTKYILTKSGTIKDGRGGSQSFSDTISFNTNQGQQFPGMETEPNTFCQANGDFEKEILSLLLNQ